MNDENLTMIGLRFRGDHKAPGDRFRTLKREFGARFDSVELDPKDADPNSHGRPHSVLTVHLNDNDPNGPTRQAEARVIDFFRTRLGA